jgi:ATP-dependent DNA ligase
MLARLAETLPPAEEFLYEPKWDGFRAIVFRAEDALYIQSRHPCGARFWKKNSPSTPSG